MNTVAATIRARESQPLLVVIVIALAAAVIWFVGHKLHYLIHYSLASYSDYYWPQRAAGLAFHLVGGFLAITAGLVQIWLGLTGRTRVLHRVLGKVYGAGVLIGSLGGFYLGFTIPAGALPYQVGLIALDVAWLITTGMALYAIRLRRLEQHREWMIRSYVVTFAFVTFRLADRWLHHWIQVPAAPLADNLDITVAWACWAIPLLIAEPLIQLRSMRRSARG